MPTSSFLTNIEIVQHGHCTNVAGEEINILNRFTYNGGLSAFTVPLNLAAAAFIAAVGPAFTAVLSTGYIDDYLTIRQMDDATYAPLIVTPGLGNGTSGVLADMVAPNITAGIALKSVKRGKNYRGYKHLSPLNEADITQGQITTGLSSMATRMAALLAAICAQFNDGTNNYVPTIMSQNLSQVAVNPVWISAVEISSTKSKYNKTLGNQKHRKFKTLVG